MLQPLKPCTPEPSTPCFLPRALLPAARELVREVDYTLKTLARSLLGQDRTEVATAELPARYETAAGLRELLLLGESDAWLALGLAFQLSGGLLGRGAAVFAHTGVHVS